MKERPACNNFQNAVMDDEGIGAEVAVLDTVVAGNLLFCTSVTDGNLPVCHRRIRWIAAQSPQMVQLDGSLLSNRLTTHAFEQFELLHSTRTRLHIAARKTKRLQLGLNRLLSRFRDWTLLDNTACARSSSLTSRLGVTQRLCTCPLLRRWACTKLHWSWLKVL